MRAFAAVCAFIYVSSAFAAKPAEDVRSSMRGPDIWAAIEGKIVFSENKPSPSAAVPAVRQEYSGPSWQAKMQPLISEMVVDRFVGDFEAVATSMRDGIDGPQLKAAAASFEGLAASACDVARMYRQLEREKRLEGEGRLDVPGELFRGQVEGGVFTAIAEWREAAELLESNANRLRLTALMRSPSRAEQAWRAVVFSALEVPQLRSTVQAVLARLERRVPVEERLLDKAEPEPKSRRRGREPEAPSEQVGEPDRSVEPASE